MPNQFIKKIVPELMWWLGVIGLLLLAHTRVEFILHLLRDTWLSNFIIPSILDKAPIVISTVVTPIRGITLLYSLSVLLIPIIHNIRSLELVINSLITRGHILKSLFVYIILLLIFTPGVIGGLAEEYANTSLVMFTRTTTVVWHTRFLMPAIANLLFFRGYFFFLIFSYLCTLVLIFVLRLWFEGNHVSVSTWQLVSLCTLSFVYYQIQWPGYPDVIINILILLAFTITSDTKSRLSLFVLCLASHEAGLIIWLGLSFLLFDARGKFQFAIIGVIYLLLLVTMNDGIAGLLSARQLGDTSGLMWVYNNLGREILGIFFAYKALWIIVGSAIWYLVSKSRLLEASKIIVIIAAGVVLTFLGIDTSRLFGLAFMAVLISWKILDQSEIKFKKLINASLVINFLIPSITVYLSGFVVPKGLYQFVLNLITR